MQTLKSAGDPGDAPPLYVRRAVRPETEDEDSAERFLWAGLRDRRRADVGHSPLIGLDHLLLQRANHNCHHLPPPRRHHPSGLHALRPRAVEACSDPAWSQMMTSAHTKAEHRQHNTTDITHEPSTMPPRWMQ